MPSPDGPVAIPQPRSGSTLSRRTSGRAADGRRWEFLSDDSSVVAVTPTGTAADVSVSEQGERVVVEFWAEPADLPRDLADALVIQAFSLPVVRPGRPIVVCVPQRAGAVLAQVRRLVRDSKVRAAGVTCLIEGWVGDLAPATPPFGGLHV
jgi:hypothetical protein